MTLDEYLERHRCTGTPQLRLIAENEYYRDFFCLTCHEHWRITRSKLKAFVREDNRLALLRQISEAERQQHKVFGPHYRGVNHA